MPSRKQRRRRAKERRHEWEDVWVDEEGNEVEPPAEGDIQSRNGKRTTAPAKRQASGRRVVQPPSWTRVGKRALIFAPLMFLTVSFLSSDLTLVQKVLNTLFLLAFFLPFSYAMDAFMYRMYTRRSGQAGR
ncbi:MAG TPA: hypothetical protein VFM83_03735 [Gaiellaceae bacterium]|jgi:hypothetical protein|nr:hypothetical protein [Gaiellaceae bacterium]